MTTTSGLRGCGTSIRSRKSHVYSGRNLRGRARIPAKAHPIVKDFIKEMNMQEKTFREVSVFSGVGIDTMRFWGHRHMPRIDMIDAALAVLGFELCIREKRFDQQ